MAEKYDEYITADELHAMLKTKGLTVGPDSPLAGLPEASADASVTPEALRQRGLGGGPWGQVLRALQQPSRCFRTLLPLPDRTAVTAYYGGADNDGLIGCWAEGGRMRISFPYSPEDLLRQGSAALSADFAIVRDSLTAELSPAGLAALAAALDVLRQRLFESVLARNTEVAMDLPTEQLDRTYAEGLAGSDARWLVTLLRVLMPASIPLPDKLSDAGLAGLLPAGLLEAAGERWQATDHLRRLAAYLKSPLPAIAHEGITLTDGQLGSYAYLIALRGDGPVWTLQFWSDDNSQPRMTLRAQRGAGYRRALRDVLLGPPEASQPTSATAASTQSSQYAGAAAEDGARVCTNCGGDLRDGASFCTQCGHESVTASPS